MNQRERILAMAVGAMVAVFGLWYFYDWMRTSLDQREKELARIQKQINEKNLVVRRGQKASQQLVRYEQQSLPSNIERAQSLYQDWLLDLVQRHQLSDSNVTAVASSRATNRIYHQFTFSLKGRASLAQATRLMHDFYSADRLHRLRRVRLKPVPDSSALDIEMMIEVLALTTAPDAKELRNAPSDRLKNGTAEDYVKAITERNIFGPPHLPPRLTSTARGSYPIGSAISFSVKGEDPEKRAVMYVLEKANFEGGALDEKTGAFTWNPESKGNYELTVRVTDGGVPPKSTTQTFKFAVVDPPPPRTTPQVVEKPKFDTAKYTYLTAVLDVDGQPEAWLVIRTTGQTLKLQPGEKFDVGSLQGTIRAITEQEVEVETSDGKRLLITIGDSLRDGAALPAGDI